MILRGGAEEVWLSSVFTQCSDVVHSWHCISVMHQGAEIHVMAYSVSKARYLERQCLLEANRAMQSTGSLNKETFLGMRVQTASPVQRIAISIIGMIPIGFSIWFYFWKKENVGSLVFGGIGLLLIGLGVVGRKRPVEVVLQGLDAVATDKILDAIFFCL